MAKPKGVAMPTKEVKIPNFPQLYKIVELLPDGKTTPTGNYRVRKRVRVEGKWTTHTETFGTFDEAKRFAKSQYHPTAPGPTRITFGNAFKRFMKHKQCEMKLSLGTLSGYGSVSAPQVF